MDRGGAVKLPESQSSGWRADDDSEHGDEELGVFTAERYFNDALTGEEALWCDRSSSSFSSAFKTWQQDESALAPTAATSSSEASWNSRSALLSNLRTSAAAPAIEGRPGSTTESEPTGGKARPSSSHLRRWILGMAGCACLRSDMEESTSADDLYRQEMDTVSVDGGKKHSSEADATLPRGMSKPTAVEDSTTEKVMSGKWVGDGGTPPWLTKPAHRRAANPGELSSMRMLDPTANASYDERRRESSAMFHHQAGQGSTLVSAKQSSAFTIVAGSTARGGELSAAGGGSGRPNPPHRRGDSVMDDSAAPSEADYMYPPSEASIVWSVVTAEGAASGNFSSAASGHYYYNNGDEAAMRHMAEGVKSNWGRRNNGGGLLMGCMSKRAVDTVGRHRTWSEVEPAPVARVRGPDMTRRR